MIQRHNLSKAIVLCMVFVLVGGVLGQSTSWAGFPSEDIKALEAKDIVTLSDDKLIEAYIEVLAELEASRMFHTTSGFTPKEYKQYKETIKYRLGLLFEIYRRKIELPPSAN